LWLVFLANLLSSWACFKQEKWVPGIIDSIIFCAALLLILHRDWNPVPFVSLVVGLVSLAFVLTFKKMPFKFQILRIILISLGLLIIFSHNIQIIIK